jgi:translation initiation factor 2 beta subunit (eIF-2beta)/eIF-5
MRCDQCEALMINGVFCHETGCPNTHAKVVDGKWVKMYECRECGSDVPVGESCTCFDNDCE